MHIFVNIDKLITKIKTSFISIATNIHMSDMQLIVLPLFLSFINFHMLAFYTFVEAWKVHVLTAVHVQIVASKSILNKNCNIFFKLSMLSLFTCSDLHDSTKWIPMFMSKVTNVTFCLDTLVRTTRLSYLRLVNSASQSKKCRKSIKKVSKSWSSGNGSALRAINKNQHQIITI